jgi:hypothetical protein
LKKVFFLFIFSFLFAFCFFTKVVHFNPSFLSSNFLEGEGSKNHEVLDVICQKPLKFLDNGGESIAFQTEDEKYVLKFFLAKKIRKKTYFKPIKRLKQLFRPESPFVCDIGLLKKYEEGFKYFPDEAALLHVSLKKPNEKLPICKVIDYRGKSYTIDLNEHPFVIQHKAKILKSYKKLAEEDNYDQKILKLFETLTSHGFCSESTGFNSANYGFLNGKAVMIDLGRLEKITSKSDKAKNEDIIKKYNKWSKRNE